MPDLSRDLVEHRLPIKAGFRPYKQPARRLNPASNKRLISSLILPFIAGLNRLAGYL